MTATTVSQSTKIRRGLGWSVAGNIVLRVGNVSMSILMARLIAPEQFGVFAVALTVWSILGTLAEFGLGSDLVRARDLERRAPTVAVLGLLTSVGLAGSMVLAAAPIAAAFQSPESEGVIRLMAVSIAIFGLAIVPAARLQRDFRQATLFGVNGLGLLASAATMTTLALQDAGPAALAWGQIANQTVIVIGLYVATRTLPRVGYDRQIARESIGFCLPLALANLVSWMLISVDNLVVARVLGPVELGLYVLAFNVSSWPMTALGQSLRVVALPGFSQVESRADRNLALVRCVAPAVAVATLMALALSTLAGSVIDLLYGSRWAAAAPALCGLAVFGGLRVILDLVATFLIAIGATTEVLLVQVAWLVVMVPSMALGVAVFGLAGAGWTHVVVAVCLVLPLYATCLRRAGVDTGRFFRESVVPLVAAVPAAVICTWIGSRDGLPAWAVLLLGGTAALVTYALPMARWWLRRIDLLRQPLTSAHHDEERA